MNRCTTLGRFTFVALFAALAFAGCKKEGAATGGGASTQAAADDNGKVLKFAFVTNNASEFWKMAAAGVHKYENEAKVQVDIKMPPQGTAEEQNQILETLESQGYDAIAISAKAPNDQVGQLDAAAAKTKLITFDSDAPKSKRLLYIGTNNFNAGKVLGAQIVKMLPSGGKMAVFVGTFSADNASQRLAGIEEAIKGHDITIVDKREDGTDRGKARSNVEDIINAHPDLNLVCGLWSYNGPAISDAIDALGKKGKVLAAVFDQEDGTMKGIDRGTIQATCVQKPFDFGYLSSKWMHDLVTSPEKAAAATPASKIVETGVEVITKDNLADYQKRLADLTK